MLWLLLAQFDGRWVLANVAPLGARPDYPGLTFEEGRTTLVDIPPALAAELDGPLAEPILLIDVADLTTDERAVVPPWWIEAAEQPGHEGVVHALAQWVDVLPGMLPKFTAQLAKAGIGVYVGRSKTTPVLAYVVTGDLVPVCWYGYPPSAQLHHPTLDLGRLPATLRALYTGLHDGFKQASAFENGFPATTELFPVSQYGSPEEFEIGDPVPDLNALVPIFFDWAGASICVELGDTDDRSGWHWSEASLRPYRDFWGEIVDNWIMSMPGQASGSTAGSAKPNGSFGERRSATSPRAPS
jgi:hypothetical protein